MENGRGNIKTDLNLRISSIVPRLKIDEPLKYHTTFRIGGPARYFSEVNNEKELRELRELCSQENISFLILGAGSNVLVNDSGFNGLVVKLAGEFNKYQFDGEKIHAGAGVFLPALINHSIENELAGLEPLTGIPGTMGGALLINAGTQYGCIGDLVEQVEVFSDSSQNRIFERKELEFCYRGSSLQGNIILKAVLNLKKGQKNDILNKIKELKIRRSQTQPVGKLCAGSVFRNPPENSAGRLIESAGLKGLTFGGARVSEKHANFIVNENDASASDVLNLISVIRQKVKQKFDIDLEPEIKIIDIR